MPPLTLNSLLTYAAIFAVLYLTFCAYQYKNRIWCSLRRADRTRIEKWAVMNKMGHWDDVELGGHYYHVEPGRTTIGWKVLLGFFPMPVRCADYTFNSARAHDPADAHYRNDFSAEARSELDMTDELKQLRIGNEQAIKGDKKKGFLDQYMPLIIIAGFGIVAYFLWQTQKKIDLLGAGQNYIESVLSKLMAK